MTTSLMKSYMKSIWELPSPSTLSYLWGFGSLLGVVMVIQVASGFLLAFYYVSGEMAWNSVVELSREVSSGWMLRLVHANTASFVFIVMYTHLCRGLVQGSFYLKGPWLSGWLIMALTMASAFLGYVLPWGQMSFWGATVIINLISVLPTGKILVTWLWGGFYVSAFTCSFFYALHFTLPFSVLLMAGVHLLLLHHSGSSTFSGLSASLKVKFSHLFSYKDMINLLLIWSMLAWLLFKPDWSADPVNFLMVDLSSSPIHIQPEWYFLHLYAVLRSIPNKVGGLIGFGLAFVLITILAASYSKQTVSQNSSYDLMSWSFLAVNIILMWLGSQPVEAPYVAMGQIMTFLYFTYLIMTMIMDKVLYELLV
uniref:Cytochrome b n=1 Tax=Longidorus vineacola TaxID=241698 RepID=A0A1P8C760_9BILA|nr:cytochrome b [Longidorus vineacola]AOT84238.1 cytochrome b [Longidorus vineacola]